MTGSAFPDAVPADVNRAGTHTFVVFETNGASTDLYFRRTT